MNITGRRPAEAIKSKLAQNSGTDVNNGRLTFFCWYNTDWLHEKTNSIQLLYSQLYSDFLQ